MSNEEHVEEMYYFAHLSGVFKEFSNEISRLKNNDIRIPLCEVVQNVFEEFVRKGLIQLKSHLFI